MKIQFTSRDIALIASFGALSATPLFLTNSFNLVAVTHIPGTNNIYVQFLQTFVLWVGVGVVGKFGSTMVLFALNSVVALLIPGGPPFPIKPFLITLNIVTGLVIDVILLKSDAFNRLIAGFAGVIRGLHTVAIQTFFGIPIAIGLPVIAAVCVSGAIGANIGIQVLRRLYNSGLLRFERET